MNQPVPINSSVAVLPVLVAVAGEHASMRFLEFFAANIRNPHTRRAYYRAAEEFLGWCASVGVPSITAVHPVHVAAWIEASTRELATPSVKQRLAALRHLFDWLVNGQVVPVNPAHTVRGPRLAVTSGQTPVLDPAEARALLDSIDTSTHDNLASGLMPVVGVSSDGRKNQELADRLNRAGRAAFALLEKWDLAEPAPGMNGRNGYMVLTDKGNSATDGRISSAFEFVAADITGPKPF